MKVKVSKIHKLKSTRARKQYLLQDINFDSSLTYSERIDESYIPSLF